MQQLVRLMQINWELLKEQATVAMKQAYAPYSKFPVGVAALVDDGRIITGCNVENASYGLTLCAECGLISSLINSGGGRLLAFTCVDISGNLLMPCGRCRQLLQEHGGSKLQLATDEGIKTLADLLPWAFGPEEMEKRLD
jgi:cytidine deaminase